MDILMNGQLQVPLHQAFSYGTEHWENCRVFWYWQYSGTYVYIVILSKGFNIWSLKEKGNSFGYSVTNPKFVIYISKIHQIDYAGLTWIKSTQSSVLFLGELFWEMEWVT